jgi:hypothetical protein
VSASQEFLNRIAIIASQKQSAEKTFLNHLRAIILEEIQASGVKTLEEWIEHLNSFNF